MKKIAGHVCEVLGRMIFIGMGIQIVLGISWMCGSFLHFQEFGESYAFLRMSENLVCDEYTGILYPFLLMLVRKITKPLALPYYSFLYVIQLLVAFFAGLGLLRRKEHKLSWKDIFGALALLCIPGFMQCHMAILPVSLAVSMLLFQVSVLKELRMDGNRPYYFLLKESVFWMLGTLLLPEYLWFGAVLMTFSVGCVCFSEKKGKHLKMLISIGIVILCFAGVWGIQQGTQKKGSLGRAEKSISLTLAHRFAGSCLEDTYGYWPEDLKECFSPKELENALQHTADFKDYFGKKVQVKLGKDRADQVFLQIAKVGYQVYYEKVHREIVWDAAACVFSPIFLQWRLVDRGVDSYMGRNYDIMRMAHPKLTKCYVNYGSWWFLFGLLLTGVWQLFQWGREFFGKARKDWRKKAGNQVVFLVPYVLTAGGMVAWYVFQGAERMDDKNTVCVVIFWTLWMLHAMQGSMTRLQNGE